MSQFEKLLDGLNRIVEKSYPSPCETINLFNIFCTNPNNELVCSNILAWLLNHRESHNKGNLFYKIFIQAAGLENYFVTDKYEVFREFRRPNSIIDLAILSRDKNKKFIIFIENKINSGEGIDQTDRQYNDAVELGQIMGISGGEINDHVICIYLSPNGEKAANKNFIPLTHSSVFTAIITAITKEDSVLKLIKEMLLKEYRNQKPMITNNLLSEDFSYIMKNWPDCYELLMKIEYLKDSYLPNYLLKLQEILAAKEWWEESLVFKQYSSLPKEQVFISQKQWAEHLDPDVFQIYIGVERFTLDTLFGLGNTPNCYLWVTGKKRSKIKQDLNKILDEKHVFESYRYSQGNYLICKPLLKYGEHNWEKFFEYEPLNMIADFMQEVFETIKGYKIEG